MQKGLFCPAFFGGRAFFCPQQ